MSRLRQLLHELAEELADRLESPPGVSYVPVQKEPVKVAETDMAKARKILRSKGFRV